MKVLLIQQKMIGDVLVSSVLCEHLKEHIMDIEVHYVINEHTLPVIENNPFIDKIILFKNEFKQNRFSFYQFLRSISNERYDVVIDVYGKLESNLIVIFSNAKIKIAYSKAYTRFLYTHPIPIASRQIGSTSNTIEDRLGLLSPLITKNLNLSKKPKIFLREQELVEAIGILRKSGVDSSNPIIMVSILGSEDSKSYPIQYLSEVLDTVVEHTNAVLLFNYLPSQKNKAKEVFDSCKKSTQQMISFETFAPSLRGFLALLNQCDCLIGNEGGSVNMAKALDVPTFSIFSPWIDKSDWHTYIGEKNVAVHFNDYDKDSFRNLAVKDLKKKSSEIYHLFKPDFFKEELLAFLSRLAISN